MSNDLNDFWDDVKEPEKKWYLIMNKKDMNNSINSDRTKNNKTINQSGYSNKITNPFLSRMINNANKTKEFYNIKIKNTSKIKSKKSKLMKFNNNKDKNILNNKKLYISNSSCFKENKPINQTINKSSNQSINKSINKTELTINSKNLVISKEKEKEKNNNKKISKMKISKKKLSNSVIKQLIKNYNRKSIEKDKKKEQINLYRNYCEMNEKMACTFRPIIHKCPKFKKVFFNNSACLSLINYNKRMDSARNEKIFKSKILPFETINYDEIYKNISDRCFCLNRNKNNSDIFHNNFQKSLSQTEFILCKNNLHSTLMKLKLKKNEIK
jgi:hypothetical protein